MQLLRFLLQPNVRWAISWLVVLGSTGIVAVTTWKGFDQADRSDGNYGHATIDFGGQWLMGRTIVEGEGRHLYLRNYLWPIAQHNYPAGVESRKAKMCDAAALMDCLAGTDDPEAAQVRASLLSPLAANSPLEETVLLASAQTIWTEEYLEQATAPRIGGALYPPIHALYYAPLSMLSPRVAYRVMQGIILALAFFAGWVIQRMTDGRIWWPVASLFVLMFPGFAGCITLGQNGMFTFTIVLLGWWQLMRGREVLAGLCWGLLAFKPVWAAAFFLVPLLTTRWRMAASMAVAGIGQIVATLPIVGWENWRNWLQIGGYAVEEYQRQENWIFLSRDLMGIPRRWLLTFEGGLAKDVVWRASDLSATVDGVVRNTWDDPLLEVLCWGLWLTVLSVTLLVVWRSWHRRKELTGLFPAFLLSGTVLTCYHFMYYDFLAAGLPVLLLFTEPRRYFQIRFGRKSELQSSGNEAWWKEAIRYYQPWIAELTPPPMPLLPQGRQPRWVIAPVPPLLLFLMLAVPALCCVLDPSYRFPPWETFVLLILWAWCGYRLLVPGHTEPEPRTQRSGVSGCAGQSAYSATLRARLG